MKPSAAAPAGSLADKPGGFVVVNVVTEEQHTFPPLLDNPLRMPKFTACFTKEALDFGVGGAGSGVSDMASLAFDQLDQLRAANAGVATLLRMGHAQFWSALIHDPSVREFLDSFLLNVRSYFTAEEFTPSHASQGVGNTFRLVAQPGALLIMRQLLRRVLMVYLRAATRVESSTEFVSTKELHGSLLFDNYIFCAHTFFDLAAVMVAAGPADAIGPEAAGAAAAGGGEGKVGSKGGEGAASFVDATEDDEGGLRGSNAGIVREIIHRVINSQPRYGDDLYDAVQVLLEGAASTEHALNTLTSDAYRASPAVKLFPLQAAATAITSARAGSSGPSTAASSATSSLASASAEALLEELSDAFFSLARLALVVPSTMAPILAHFDILAVCTRLFDHSLPSAAARLRLGVPSYRRSPHFALLLRSLLDLARVVLRFSTLPAVGLSLGKVVAAAADKDAGGRAVANLRAAIATLVNADHGAHLPLYFIAPSQPQPQQSGAPTKGEAATSATGATAVAGGGGRFAVVAGSPIASIAALSQPLSAYSEPGALLYFLARADPQNTDIHNLLTAKLTPQAVAATAQSSGPASSSAAAASASSSTPAAALITAYAAVFAGLGGEARVSLLRQDCIDTLARITTLPPLVGGPEATASAGGMSGAATGRMAAVAKPAIASASAAAGSVWSAAKPLSTTMDSTPSLAKLADDVATMRDMFPNYGPEFAEAVLALYGYDTERAITAVMDDQLPKQLKTVKDKRNYRLPGGTLAERQAAAAAKAAGETGPVRQFDAALTQRDEGKHRGVATSSSAGAGASKGILDDPEEDAAFQEYLRQTGRSARSSEGLALAGLAASTFVDAEEREQQRQRIRAYGTVVDMYDDEYDDALDEYQEFVVDQGAEGEELDKLKREEARRAERKKHPASTKDLIPGPRAPEKVRAAFERASKMALDVLPDWQRKALVRRNQVVGASVDDLTSVVQEKAVEIALVESHAFRGWAKEIAAVKAAEKKAERKRLRKARLAAAKAAGGPGAAAAAAAAAGALSSSDDDTTSSSDGEDFDDDGKTAGGSASAAAGGKGGKADKGKGKPPPKTEAQVAHEERMKARQVYTGGTMPGRAYERQTGRVGVVDEWGNDFVPSHAGQQREYGALYVSDSSSSDDDSEAERKQEEKRLDDLWKRRGKPGGNQGGQGANFRGAQARARRL